MCVWFKGALGSCSCMGWRSISQQTQNNFYSVFSLKSYKKTQTKPSHCQFNFLFFKSLIWGSDSALHPQQGKATRSPQISRPFPAAPKQSRAFVRTAGPREVEWFLFPTPAERWDGVWEVLTRFWKFIWTFWCLNEHLTTFWMRFRACAGPAEINNPGFHFPEHWGYCKIPKTTASSFKGQKAREGEN